MHTRRLSTLAGFLILTLVLVAAMLLTTPVFAQDEVPPAPEETPAEVAPVEEPAPVEEAPVEEPAPLEEAPAEEPAPEIVPLDGNGEALSLATQEAADAMAEPDPWFACTGDIDGICSYAGANSLNTALSNYAAMGGSGPIYLEGGTHTVSANVTINGATLANLTGIMAETGESSATVNLNLGAFYLNATNLANGFTLKGMNITGNRSGALLDFDANTGALNLTDLNVTNANAGGDGIEITNHTGNVTLHTVKVDENGDQGAVIVSVTGNVSMTNSSFDSNSISSASPYNLAIQATGAITLNGVSASNFNSGNGAVLESQKSITVKNSIFNNNSVGGLMILDTSKGPVLMDHVYANTNGGTGIEIETQAGSAVTMNTIEALNNSTGVEIDNCWESGGVCTAASAAVTLSNFNLQNPLGNLLVKSNGNISVATIKAFYASDPAAVFAGIELDNHLATAAKSVTLTNAESRYNLFGGVVINTRGVVTLNHVNASSNSYASAPGISITSSGTAAVNILSTLGENVTSNNNGNGTYILTNGAVSISKLTASSNIMTNVFIDNDSGTSPVTLNSGDFSYSSTGSGLYVTSRGAITLTNVVSEYNANDGILLSNETAASNQAVTIKPSTAGATTSVGYNGGSALQITSKGAVSVTGLNDNNSSVNGRILIDNTYGTGTVSLTNMSVNTVNDPSNRAAVTVYSHGAITATDVTSTQNLERGIYLNNSTAAGTPGVTIKNLYTQNNLLAGFDILSRGAVKITNADVYSNDGGEASGKIVTTGSVTMDAIGSDYSYLYYGATNGLWIDAGGAISLKRLEIYNNNPGYGLRIVNGTTVSISDSYFSENSLFGLDVTCSGAITLTNTNVNNNGTSGATLINSSGTAGVTITGSSSNYSNYENNPTHNLSISTLGALKLSYVSIEGSPTAIWIAPNVGDVTITGLGINVPSGATPALDITSLGTVTITTLNTYSASGSGVQINNSGATSAKAVTITDFYDTSTAGSYALRVLSKGAITLTNFYVNNNGGVRTTGIYLDNTASTTKAAVSIKTPGAARDYNYAQYFTGNGVEVHSHGQVTLDDMYLRYNNGTGLKVNDALETSLGGVTVTNSYIRNNTHGMNISAGGAIVIGNTRAYGNNGMGVVLDNSGATSVFPVTVTELDAYDNDTGGLTIDSRGTVTITNLDAYTTDLSGYGLDIDTDGAVSIGYTSTSWNNLYGNAGSGVLINAGGNVTIKRLGSYDNLGGFGASIISGGAVSITDGNIYNNATFGLNIIANGAITLTNVDGYSNNGSYGAMLDNHLGSGGVTIKGKASDWSSFQDNVTDNLAIITKGAVTIGFVNANEGTRGATINSSGGSVTISEGRFNFNNEYGLDILAAGTISLNKVDCESNYGTWGARLDNHAGSGGITINGLVTDWANFNSNLGTNLILNTAGAVTMNYIVADGNGVSTGRGISQHGGQRGHQYRGCG